MISLLKQAIQRLVNPMSGPRFQLDPFEPLSAQPDRELDVLLERLVIDDDTLEIHLALGELFRKRGQIDRAIRVHEALLEADLAEADTSRVRVELAQDFFSGGFLGHAESILESMIVGDGMLDSARAFRLWLAVLEREQEWERAIELVRKYGQAGSGSIRLANFYCELAIKLSHEGQTTEARQALKEARRVTDSARTYLVSAELDTTQGNYHRAIRWLRDGLDRDVRRIDVILPALKRLSRLTGGEATFRKYLETLYQRHPSHRILSELLDLVGPNDPRALQWQNEFEQIVHSGASFELMQRWIEQRQDIGDRARTVLIESLKRIKLRLSDQYQCTHCGFESTTLLWYCPQCERWETLYSRHEQRTFESSNT